MKNKKENEFKLPAVEMIETCSGDMEYGEDPFDPAEFGFDLDFVGYLPTRKSVDISESPIGIGYEILDRDGYDFEKTLPIMKESGVKWARVQSGWNKTEKKAGVYDFKWLDEIVDGLLKIGIIPWISVSYGNALYTPYSENNQPRPNFGYANSVPLHYGEKAVQAWKDYCYNLARHFKGKVSHWEVWNEPNVGFWGKIPDAAEYVELVKITSEQIHKASPEAKIIGGAISGAGCCNQYINSLVKEGICKYIDIFSYHPYGLVPEMYIESRIKYIRNIFDKHGIKLWQGECGRPSSTSIQGRGYKQTLAKQAKYVTRRIMTDLWLGFDMTSYFLVADQNEAYCGPGKHHHQGVIETQNYTAKPSFKALQSMACLFDSDTVKTDLCCSVQINHQHTYKLCSCLDFYAKIDTFKRGNIPLYSYYLPENIDIDMDPKRIDFEVWVDAGEQLRNPVLIDPLTQKIYKIKNFVYCNKFPFIREKIEFGTQKAENRLKEGCLILLKSMPMLNYPLFITDFSIFSSL